MSVPCPACDVDHSDQPLECLALGVALGQAFGGMDEVTSLMCASHQRTWIMAMLRASIKANAAPTERHGTEEQ